MSEFGTTTMVTAGAAINIVHQVDGHADPIPTALAAVILAVICAAIEEASPGLGTAFAAVYLVGSLLIHGQGLINLVAALTGSDKEH